MSALPNVMVAPNGARHTKNDHPALPMTLEETIQTSKACFNAGARGLHLHLRDANGAHVLDCGLYREALQELKLAVPTMALQITTEAVGLYSPDHQMQVALNSGAVMVSASIRELTTGQDAKQVEKFYQTAADQGIHIQHIIYDLSDFQTLKSALPQNLFRNNALQLLFVLGRYGARQSSSPEMLDPFLRQMQKDNLKPDWAVCAFGHTETPCLLHAWQMGGKIRAGFENSFWNHKDSIAQDNAERICVICNELRTNSSRNIEAQNSKST